MNNKKLLSIIVPFYNEENFILKSLDQILSIKTDLLDKEIILVDDGSTDNSLTILKKRVTEIKKINKQDSIKIIQVDTNHGKGFAVKQGLIKSHGDIVLIQDADLEYDPHDYQNLLEPFINHNADVVYGSRFVTNRPHRVLYFWHYIGNIFLTTLSNILTNLNFTDIETGYKVFRGDLIRSIAPKIKSNDFGIEPELTAYIATRKNLKIYEVGISYWGRTYQEGKKIRGIVDGFKAIIYILYFNIFRKI